MARMNALRSVLASTLAIAGMGVSGSFAKADNYTWTAATTGTQSWNTDGNWNLPGFPNSSFPTVDTAAFGTATGSFFVNLNQAITVYQIDVTNNGAFGMTIVDNGGSLHFGDIDPRVNYFGNGSGDFTFTQSATYDGVLTVTNSNTGGGNIVFRDGLLNGENIVTNGSGTVEFRGTIEGNLEVFGGSTAAVRGDNFLDPTGNLKLNNGTFSTGLDLGYSQTVVNLSLETSSAISLGTGTHALTFETLTDNSMGGDVLTINGWSGDQTGGTAGRLIMTSYGTDATQANADLALFLSKVQFTGYEVGGGAIFIVNDIHLELVPVPEPTTVFALGAAGLGLAGYLRRRTGK